MMLSEADVHSTVMFVNQDLISTIDAEKAEDVTLVIDGNCQGIFELTAAQRTFKARFPGVYMLFLEECIKGKIVPGTCNFYTEDNYNIAILATENIAVGSKRDSSFFELSEYMESAMYELFNYLQEFETTVVSPIMGRHIERMGTKSIEIVKEFCETFHIEDWIICTK